MGTYTSTDPNPSEKFSDYYWVKIMGDNGADGADGEDGKPGKDGQMLYATCQAGAAFDTKPATLSTGTISNPPTLGTAITVKFTNANTAAAPTLNVGSTGNYPIKVNANVISATNPYYWKAGTVISFVFDGSNWVVIDTTVTKCDLTSEGLVVGNWIGDDLRNNVLIGASSVDIRGGKTVYASYGANTIYLGKNSTDSTIDLCDGSLQMKLTTYSDDTNFFGMTAPKGSLGMSGYGFASLYASPYVDDGYSYADITANGQESQCWAATRKFNIITKDTYATDIKACADENNGYVLLAASIPSHRVELKLDATSDKVDITGGGLAVAGELTFQGGIKPYYTAGDSIDVAWTGGGFISDSGKGVFFTIPLAKPVKDVSGVDVKKYSTSGGLRVRQHKLSGDKTNGYTLGGDYCDGVASNTFVDASSYSPTLAGKDKNGYYNFIRIEATMPNSTNATNNAPCGVHTSLTITFK